MNQVREIEKKWQKKWEEEKLGEFNYSKLHMGHWYQYGIMDTWSRFQKMMGKNVFQPMGFDAFGLPAENFAIKHGIHPEDSTNKNISIMMEQFKAMGVSFAWKNYINTSSPEYYKWTQWIFLQFLKNDLAYQKKAPVNWCTQCQTVLANEQVLDGACERCSSEVIKKNLKQWFLKITKYADRLLDGIDNLNWPEKTKLMQKNWIGKSQGSEITFKTEDGNPIKVFTTRPDTLFGVSYLVLAPEHSLVDSLTSKEQKKEVTQYKEETAKISEIERLSTEKEKTGVFTGSFVIHPLTGKKVPLWISDYVLASYGTGAVMGVPAHDERDYIFAQKYKLPIIQVIEGDISENAYTGEGKLINSSSFDGITNEEAKRKITKALEDKNLGEEKTIFRLRDWLIGRQRYWGCPIPIIHCEDCGAIPVEEKNLPVKLPRDVDFRPTGESPLKAAKDWLETTCPKCNKKAEREADTMDTFLCSSWYFLRYPCSDLNDQAFDKDTINKMLPVDHYVGGPEHACMHLLYARFFTMALKDIGLVNFDEPFPKLTHQGLVLGRDGQKMSKSKGNSESPDPYVEKYGSDILRLYLMFGFNFVEGGPWVDGGVKAIVRFRDRLDRFISNNSTCFKDTSNKEFGKAEKELYYVLHNSIQRIRVDMEKMQFNTSLARLMELLNALYSYEKIRPVGYNYHVSNVIKEFLLLMAPFAPHFCEEWWSKLGFRKKSLFLESYPDFNKKYLEQDTINMAIMINGKLRGEIEVSSSANKEEIIAFAKKNEKAAKFIEGKNIVKEILVPKKLINFIVK